jgi:hypothetical protein
MAGPQPAGAEAVPGTGASPAVPETGASPAGQAGPPGPGNVGSS